MSSPLGATWRAVTTDRWSIILPTLASIAVGRSFDVSLEYGQHPCLHDPDNRGKEPVEDETSKPARAEDLITADHQTCAPAGQLIQQEAPETIRVGRRPRLLEIKTAASKIGQPMQS